MRQPFSGCWFGQPLRCLPAIALSWMPVSRECLRLSMSLFRRTTYGFRYLVYVRIGRLVIVFCEHSLFPL
jgi:hypothetical protein